MQINKLTGEKDKDNDIYEIVEQKEERRAVRPSEIKEQIARIDEEIAKLQERKVEQEELLSKLKQFALI